MATTNDQLASIFSMMADIMTILDIDRFRVNATAKAARSIENARVDLASIADDTKELTKIDGIGKSTAEKITQFCQTGKMDAFDELLEQIPEGLIPLLDISGLGPKKIRLLWQEAGVESKDDLKAKLQTDELAELPGMGKKTIENLRKSIDFAEKSTGRVRLGHAMQIALALVDALEDVKGVQQVTYAGSLRRGKETIGDLDLLVAADEKDAGNISDAFVDLPIVDDVLVKGKTKTSIRTKDGVQCDLRIVEPDQFGAALMYFTGSKEHNVAMRQRAINKGMSLNEYALTRDGEPVASKTEEDVFAALDLKWIPPEMREDFGELALAAEDDLPKLLDLKDIKAELHAHTDASDGHWTIREFAEKAADRGYHTIAITDHSKGQAQANGLDEKRLVKHIKAVRKVADELADTITILAGSEVDILADGSLDYDDELLAELDVVVASPHAALSQDPDKATDRLLRAIENPYVTILGHPTGRLINRREGLSPDMAKLIKASAERGIAMEINANHYRLDLRDHHARMALEAGVKLAINTDAHGEPDLDQLQYGVLTARRAGATKEDVVNTMSKSALAKWLKSTRT